MVGRGEEVARRPAELVLTASIARRFYVDRRSKSDIADEFGLSRFKVARILDNARLSGVVRIEVGVPSPVDTELSDHLREVTRLHRAIVLDVPEGGPGETLRQHLAEATADLLTELVVPGDVLGLAWSRTLSATSKALTRLAPCTVVQLNGTLSRSDVDENSVDLVRTVARIGGGQAFPFYAPFLVPDAKVAKVMRRQPDVAAALACCDAMTKAAVAIGSWDPPRSTVYEAVDGAERRLLRDLGVVAEICGVFLDAAGRPVSPPLRQRVIGVTPKQLQRVPEVIGVAYGSATAGAVRAAVRGGVVTTLVTHATLARELLRDTESAG